MSQEYGSIEAELLALEHKRAQIALSSTIAIIFLAAVLFWGDSVAGPVLVPVVLIGVGKGFANFREHGKRMKELEMKARSSSVLD